MVTFFAEVQGALQLTQPGREPAVMLSLRVYSLQCLLGGGLSQREDNMNHLWVEEKGGQALGEVGRGEAVGPERHSSG